MEKMVLNSKEHLDASAGVYCAENGLKCRISEDNEHVKISMHLHDFNEAVDVTVPNEVVIDGMSYPVYEFKITPGLIGRDARLQTVSLPRNLKMADFGELKFNVLYINGCRDLVLKHGYGEKICYDTIETFLSIKKGLCAEQILVAGAELTDLAVPDGITEICEYFVSGCSTLRSVVLPNSVVKINNYAFDACSNLMNIELSQNLEIIGIAAFSHCEKLSAIKLHEGLKLIGTYAFSYCKNLDEIVIPSTVEGIGGGAFGHTGIRKIEIHDGVTQFYDGMFSDCYKLEEVRLPGGLQEIGRLMFYNCESLTEIVLPSQLVSIGSEAFAFSGLKKITIPATVTNIGGYAFEGCKNLADVYCEITDPTQCEVKKTLEYPAKKAGKRSSQDREWNVGEELFYKNATLHLPNVKGIVAAYKKKAAWKKFADIVSDLETV